MSIILTVSAAGLACAALPPPGPIGPPPGPPEGAGPPPDVAVTLGPPTELLSAGQLGLAYFPDQALTIVPVLSAQRFDGADAFGPHVVWSAALRRSVMTFVLDAWKEVRERRGLRRSGIYFATSQDGVAWSRPDPLFIDWPVNVVGMPVSWHPAIVLDEGSSTAGWLVYGHTDRWDPPRGTPHHLWGRRITLAPRP